MNARLHARRVAAASAASLRSPRAVAGTRIAPRFSADRGGMAADFPRDLAARESAAMKVLNLVAFVVAQARVAHVQFPLAARTPIYSRRSWLSHSTTAEDS